MTLTLRTTFRIDHDADNPFHARDIEKIKNLIESCGFTTSHLKGVSVTRPLNGEKK